MLKTTINFQCGSDQFDLVTTAESYDMAEGNAQIDTSQGKYEAIILWYVTLSFGMSDSLSFYSFGH